MSDPCPPHVIPQTKNGVNLLGFVRAKDSSEYLPRANCRLCGKRIPHQEIFDLLNEQQRSAGEKPENYDHLRDLEPIN